MKILFAPLATLVVIALSAAPAIARQPEADLLEKCKGSAIEMREAATTYYDLAAFLGRIADRRDLRFMAAAFPFLGDELDAANAAATSVETGSANLADQVEALAQSYDRIARRLRACE